MQDFQGWDLKAVWRDLKFDVKHASQLEKVAMVNAKDWEVELTNLMNPFTSAEVHFFETGERKRLLSWIKK